MKNKKERYIFCPRLLDIANDIWKLEETDNKLSNKTKINILRHYTEWLIIDFMYRTLIGKNKDYQNYNEVIQSFEHKRVPTILNTWNKANIIDDIQKEELESAWQNVFIKVYHLKLQYTELPLDQEYKKLFEIIQKLSTSLKNYWLNKEITFTNNINSRFNNVSHFVYENKNIICRSANRKINNFDKPLIKIKIIDLINNYLIKQSSKSLNIKEGKNNIYICTYCLKRIFGINQNSEDIKKNNLTNYLRDMIRNNIVK